MVAVLLVEDDETIGKALHTSLGAHGYTAHWATTGHGALRMAAGTSFALVLLDLGLPDLDGIAVCRELRATDEEIVIVMLTARDEEMDVVIGLEAGADDYLTKPIRLAELHARIRAHLRRADNARPAPARAMFGDLVLDHASRRVTIRQEPVPLRAKEYDLLARLAADPGVALSRETLMTDVWDDHWHGSTKTLDVHVAALRRRLAEHGAGAALPVIATLRGHGYRLDPPAAAGGPGTSVG